jgi:predicted PurR-regulated permease PerM
MAARAIAERVFLVGTILVLGWLTFLIFKPFFDWVILGFLFAYLFYKPYERTLKHVKRRGAAAGLVLLLVLVVFLLPFVVLLVFFFQDFRQFALELQETNYEEILRTLMEAVTSLLGIHMDAATLDQASNNIGGSLRATSADFVRGIAANLVPVVARLVVGLFIFGFTVFYGLVDGPRIIEGVLSVVPLHRPEKRLLLHELKRVTDAVFVGHVLVAFIQAFIGTVGFLVLGVPQAFLWGFVMLLASIIPVLGPFVVWIPIGIYLLVTEGDVSGVFSHSRRFAALGVLLVVGPVISTIDNVLRPKLVGDRADVHPFLILVGALGGILVFGFTGFIVGPLVLSLFLAVLRVYRLHWRGDELHDHRITLHEARKRIRPVAPKEKKGRRPKPAPTGRRATA